VERFNIWPPGMYHRKIGGQHLFSTVVVVRGADHAHIYVAGKTSIQPDGSIGGVNDLRGQIGLVCKGIKDCVEYVGATLDDVVRTVTYVLDIDAYYRVADERYKYFSGSLPANTLRDEIKRRIEQASKFIDIGQLCLSPQCGFFRLQEACRLHPRELGRMA
jgi:enamine deaminase RidA (YjgF/YER057c/UK114 family)